MNNPIRVLVVDDHTIERKGLSSLLNAMSSLEIVGEAATGAEMVLMVCESHPDIVLIDCKIFQQEGPDPIWRIWQENPNIVVLVLFHHAEDSSITLEYELGRLSFTRKDLAPEELARVIQGMIIQ